MLKSLNIENIAIIEKCNIEFDENLNILTGETGAGKSIIIDSINACLGHRTSKDLIRTGKANAKVSAFFENVSKEVLLQLAEFGVDVSDGNVLITRVITADKTSCKVNGMPVNVTTLKEMAKYLINIHGQHDNQALLDPENHCSYIDMFAKLQQLKDEYYSVYSKLRNSKSELKKLKQKNEQIMQRFDLLEFQTQEIKAADLKDGEKDKLSAQRKLIQNSEKIVKTLNSVKELLNGNEEIDGIVSNLNVAATMTNGLTESLESAQTISNKLASSADEISAIAEEIRAIADGSNFDPSLLKELDERIDVINSVIKKYGGSEKAALNYYETASAELDSINKADQRIEELENEISNLEEQLYNCGLALTKHRKSAAQRFECEVLSVLKYLEMPDVKFKVDFEQGIYTKDGCDKVEFLISANIGQDLKPLAKIASGGELSRIMLAIKSVLAKIDLLDTMIFDEIDSGISGIAADKVGRQLKKVALDRQVICVTHLAQIASKADNHYLIKKSVQNDSTITDVTHLDYEGRRSEIARIIGGNVTERSLAAAAEMLEN